MAKLHKLFMLILIATPALLFAQRDSLQSPAAEHKARAIAQRMQEDLDLSKTQTDKVYDLAMKRFENLTTLKTDPARYDKANQQALEKLPAILTKQQWEKYKALRADAKKQRADYVKQNPAYKPSEEDIELDF